MTDEEVNRIIAEYMEYPISNDGLEVYVLDRRWEPLCEYFTESLDALIPVWGKLQDHGLEVLLTTSKVSSESSVMIWKTHQDDCCGCYERVQEDELGSSVEGTVQQAAAYATAKAIKELK